MGEDACRALRLRHGSGRGRYGLDQRGASFDKLRMRAVLSAMTNAPHPELVEGRTLRMRAYSACFV